MSDRYEPSLIIADKNRQMLNLMHGAGRYSGNKLNKTDFFEHDTAIGPKSNSKRIIDAWKKLPKNQIEPVLNQMGQQLSDNAQIYDAQPTAAILTHEMGHVQDNYGVNVLDSLPVIGDVRNLWRERQANKKSWDAINKIYKDDPELIKMIGDQRSRILPTAYGTYALANGLPIATTALGGYLGYRRYKGKQKQYQQAVDRINKQLLLSDKDKKDQIAKLRKSNKWLNIGVGAGLGYMGGKVIGGIGTAPLGMSLYDKSRSYNEYKATDAIHQRMMQHAKDRGYYNNVDLNQTIGID